MRYTVAIFFLLFFSCKNVNIDKELGQIDSLQTVILNAEKVLNEIDINALVEIKKEINADLDVLKEYYNDTLEWELAKFLSGYNRINKSLGKYLKTNQYLMVELSYSKEQLGNLRNDLSKNIISIDSFNVYIKVEIEAITELATNISSNVPFIKKNISRYKESKPKVKEILMKIAES